MRRFYGHAAEQGVAGDLAVELRDEREQSGSVLPQFVDQISLVNAPERSFVHDPELPAVLRLLVSDVRTH
jgi:hypothetical protein